MTTSYAFASTGTQAANVELPTRAGLGLKAGHFEQVLGSRPDIGFFEVHAENYMVDGGPFHHFLGLIRELYPLSLHGVGLSIGSEGKLDATHLQRLAELIDRYQPQAFSEHLAWSSHGPVFLNDLLPLAYDAPTLNRVCAHIGQVQDTLKRPMLLENPATYLAFQRSTLDEADFISEVIRRTGCGLLLDVNNLYVSCINHQRDPLAYLDALPLQAVGEIHLAGFAEDSDNLGDRLLIDDHGAPIDPAVWTLYRQALERVGPVATLIERDNQVPAFGVLLAEAHQADALLQSARRPT
ncbi:MNIO family bufferin maturase [Pseudomonas mediterranea]